MGKFDMELREYEASNMLYIRDSIPENYADIIDLIRHHQTYQVPRLEKLYRYYLGRNDGILRRDGRKGEDKADYRSSHPFAENITTFRTSYLVGNPVKTLWRDKDIDYDDVNAWFDRWNVQEDIDSHNLDLVTDVSMFGRGYELLNYDESDQIKVSLSHPFWTFMVYDETTEQNPLFAVRYPTVVRDGDELVKITIYTKDSVWYFDPIDIGSNEIGEPTIIPHAFDDIPIIEYFANRFRTGDFEKVLPDIDLYDYSQSDTANYMTDTNESILVISGDFDPSRVEYDKDANMLLLPTGMSESGQQSSLNAQYIYPQYDVAGTESYKNRLRTDIYVFTYTPDVSDETFGGQQTGVALRYKLIGLEQDRATKERMLRKGFNRRYRMVGNMAKVVASDYSYDVDMNDLVVSFTPNLPANWTEELRALKEAGAVFSQKTLLSQASFVDNVQDEMAALEEERQSGSRLTMALERQARMTDDVLFGDEFDGNQNE